jgi:hypothetical protein
MTKLSTAIDDPTLKRLDEHIAKATALGTEGGDLFFKMAVEQCDELISLLELGQTMTRLPEATVHTWQPDPKKRDSAVAEVSQFKVELTAFSNGLTKFRDRVKREWKGPWASAADISKPQ